ncbi:hypothetical protein FS749_010109 [Ceratobasidium sp. UAMH 11750]|nr:hypothetical protein FS749_010109 [Ceratobasidium sp. UAMH 11750]
MDILRAIRNLGTRSRATKLSGIRFNKNEDLIQVKVVFVGDDGAGKSNLIYTCNRRKPWLLGETPPNKYEWSETEINTPHGLASIVLWDTCALEEYDRLRPLSYPGTGIISFVFGLDSPDSLANVEQKWKVEVDHFCRDVPKVVIGCKSDLRTSNSPHSLVDTQSGIDLATRLGARHYIECSAQQYVGIEKVLESIGSMAWEIYEHTKVNRSVPNSFELSIILPENDAPQGGKNSKDGAHD